MHVNFNFIIIENITETQLFSSLEDITYLEPN